MPHDFNTARCGLKVATTIASHDVERPAFRRRIIQASVPILKFLCTFYLSVECAATETTDGCQDIIGRFGPAERLGRGISDFDICGYRGLEFGDGAMRPALDLLVGQEREEALDLIDPG